MVSHFALKNLKCYPKKISIKINLFSYINRVFLLCKLVILPIYVRYTYVYSKRKLFNVKSNKSIFKYGIISHFLKSPLVVSFYIWLDTEVKVSKNNQNFFNYFRIQIFSFETTKPMLMICVRVGPILRTAYT